VVAYPGLISAAPPVRSEDRALSACALGAGPRAYCLKLGLKKIEKAPLGEDLKTPIVLPISTMLRPETGALRDLGNTYLTPSWGAVHRANIYFLGSPLAKLSDCLRKHHGAHE
jgi:hypothetical protein